ncbi:PREDICTED: F-box/FBD/LRR-repeat protein At1g51370-like [Camelina sativa]|uniref:F-box/FBD/LRR-repeat protein At1g51370-like n=1 Tax=Camelina sativa TaxID=90675 RepID=A0ABM0X9Q7_CAMSA|nr:PREDICTED: F-box/FBD/LRR-repeat protein At1g51370-like [Camelina sativa]
MVGRKKTTKICDKASHEEEEDRISQLPESLISEILYHLPTKDVVTTSVLSTRWRNLWQSVPGLDLDYVPSSQFDDFVSFVEKLFNSNRESWIRKLRLNLRRPSGTFDLTSRVDAVTRRRVQHLDVTCYCISDPIPLSIYTCETLVHLRLQSGFLPSPDFVSLPRLKFIHLECVSYSDESTLEKLISGSPVLEDLTLIGFSTHTEKVTQVRSHSLKRIHIRQLRVVIDAPLLQCLKIGTIKNYDIVNLGFFTKLDIDVEFVGHSSSYYIPDILTDISKVRDLVIGNAFWQDIFLYSKSGPVLQFRNLSRLNARLSKSDLELLPLILESCTKLESLTLELVKDKSKSREKKKNPNVMFSTVPQCLVTSLKFVELKRSIPGYEEEIKLIRYLLKNSTILEKLRLNVYYSKKAMCDFLKEVVAMPRGSTACEVLVL